MMMFWLRKNILQKLSKKILKKRYITPEKVFYYLCKKSNYHELQLIFC